LSSFWHGFTSGYAACLPDALQVRIPEQICHPFQTNAAIHSILRPLPMPVNIATPGDKSF
jgi:hypothetical protein